MNARLHPGMLDALRLTRAGQLLEATAMLQSILRDGLDSTTAADTSPETIDGECHVIDTEPATMAGPAANPEGRPSFGLPATFLSHVGVAPGGPWRRYFWPAPPAETIPAPDIGQEDGRFVSGSYSNQAGTRSYKLYIPRGYHGQPLPLVVMLHGCTQDPDDFAAGTRMNELAEAQPCLVVYPAQTATANGSKCWNWFKGADQHRDQGEPSIIAGMTREILATYHLDRQKIYVAGLSAGGAMALTMAMTYPDLYAAVGIHSGLPHGAAKDLPSALMMMQGGRAAAPGRRDPRIPGGQPGPAVPIIVFHGDQDKTVHPGNGDQVIAQCTPRSGKPAQAGRDPRVRVERGQVPKGHAYMRTTYHDADGKPIMEQWLIHGAGHAWSGGSPRGSYTDPKGPDATREMLRFFLEHPQSGPSAIS